MRLLIKRGRELNQLHSFMWFALFVIGIVSCSANKVSEHSDPEELKSAYISDFKNTSVDITFERGHNLHRIYAFHKPQHPELQMFRDKQVYKSLQIKEEQFKELLLKSIDTAGAFYRKIASAEQSRCRTPFQIKVVSSKDKLEVEGCRSSDEGIVFGKLISEIEYLASVSSIH